MKFFEGLQMRSMGIRRAAGASCAPKRQQGSKPCDGRTRLSVVCQQADLQSVRRRMHDVLRAVEAEIMRVEVTPMASCADLFSVCFTVTYPLSQRKALMDQLGMFADDASVHRIRFGSISAADPIPAG